ncbi:hypothetical protein [Rhodococcus ruber]
MTTVTVTAPVAGGSAGTGSGATVEAMPAAEDLTPRGNAVGTVGEPLTSGCVGQVCDLTVTVTGIEVNPANCDVYGDGQVVAVRHTIVTGPNLPAQVWDPMGTSSWMAVDEHGTVNSKITGGWVGCGDSADELMPNSTYHLTTPLNVPATHTTLIWRPINSGKDLIAARGLEFSLSPSQ